MAECSITVGGTSEQQAAHLTRPPLVFPATAWHTFQTIITCCGRNSWSGALDRAADSETCGDASSKVPPVTEF